MRTNNPNTIHKEYQKYESEKRYAIQKVGKGCKAPNHIMLD